MKLNGALKPRQGASRQGSSPGVVLRKYRGKRYYNVNENVVNGLPLYECGVNNINQNVNSNNNNNLNQQQLQQQQRQLQRQQTQQTHREEEEIVCGEDRNSDGLCFSNFSTLNIKTDKNKTTSRPITKYRISIISKIAAYIDYNSRSNNSNKNQQRTSEEPATAWIENNQKQTADIDIEIELKQKTFNNNKTPRQLRQIIDKEKNNNNDEKKRKIQEVKSFKTTSNTSQHHVTVNNIQNKNNNNNSNININQKVKIYESRNLLTVIISRLFKQFELLLSFMFLHTKNYLAEYPIGHCGGKSSRSGGFDCSFNTVGNILAKMRAAQSLKKSFKRVCFKNVNKSRLPPSIALCLMLYAAAAIFLPQMAAADDGENFYPINGLETTTPEFDYASRGQKKFGDKCDNTLECGFPGSICDPKKKSCQCTEDLPVTNHIDKCGKEAAVNESCFFNEQCEVKYFQTECRDQRCVCRFDMTPVWLKDGSVECKGRGDKKGPETYIDPAMIGVLIGMALMFIIICVVLRLFSQARWRENRTIFNTPNPRLMNVSLLRESKLLHGQERRGSRMSVRAPSRQPSMASLRPHSPNPSLGKTGSRSNSHGSNASGTSLRSTRSNSVSPAGIVVNNAHHHERKGSTYQPHQHHHPPQQQQQQEQQPLTQTNIIANPVAETVTVEIIEPEK